MTYFNIKNYPIKNNTTKNKIGIIISGKTSHYSASSCIRLLSPLNEITTHYSISIIDDESIFQFKEDLNEKKIKLDLIIIQRDILLNSKINDFEFINSLYNQCKINNIPIIFDIDDDLLHIDPTHVDYEEYKKIQPILEYIMLESNIITVTNNILKNQIKKFNENLNIIIIPNTLIHSWNFSQNFNKKKFNKNTVKIGYFGGNSHKNDLKIIKNAIKNIKNTYPNKKIIFETIGISNEKEDWITKVNIPNNYNSTSTMTNKLKNILSKVLQKLNLLEQYLPFYSFVTWMRNENDWDIGVAPLEDNNINRSKSNLKYLEYTALDIPGIYSNIGPYKEINNNNSGLVVNNTTEEWENAIITLIEDNNLYKTLLANAKKDIKNNYLVENASSAWKNILNQIFK